MKYIILSIGLVLVAMVGVGIASDESNDNTYYGFLMDVQNINGRRPKLVSDLYTQNGLMMCPSDTSIFISKPEHGVPYSCGGYRFVNYGNAIYVVLFDQDGDELVYSWEFTEHTITSELYPDDNIVLDTVEWSTAGVSEAISGSSTFTIDDDNTHEFIVEDGDIVFTLPGDTTIEGLFDQDCMRIGWNKKTEKLVCYEYSKKITNKGECKMFSFLLGWMGSLLFWVVFFAVSFFAGTMFIKTKAPKTLKFITSKKQRELCAARDQTFVFLIFIIAIYLFWPVFLIALIVGFILKRIIFDIFIKLFKYTVDNIPTISFDKKPESE